MKQPLSISILLTLLMSMVGLCASAHDFEAGGIYYVYNDGANGSSVSVSYRGDSYYEYADEYSGSLTIFPSVTYNGKTFSVTSIGFGAFEGCSGLTSVTIPSSVTSIGGYAFAGCHSLTSVTIPSSVTNIGLGAFGRCSGLTSVTIPSSVTSIGSGAFEGCSGLTSIYVDSQNSNYDSRGNCNAIIRISDNTLIAGCKNTIIPKSVTSIGSEAFGGCSGLTTVTIPSSVTSIGYDAFYGCDGLTSVTIPSSVTSIGSAAFASCSGLTSIYVDSQNRIYDSRGNCNAIITISDNTLIAGCKNTIIPNSVTSIDRDAFYGCSGLTSVTIPSSVTSIGIAAFYGCGGLTSVTIPSSVTSIGSAAFEDCSGLTSVTIPSSVTSIGSGAFWLCGALFSVIVDIREPLSISSDAFHNYANATLTVPFGRKKAYETAEYWKDFKEIVEMPMSEADIASNTILPWGAQQAWEMKYMFFDGTDSEPAADGSGHAWYEEEYDDESWETLSGPIANISDWFSSVNTLWNTEGHESSSYCLRRTFHLDEVDEQGYTFLSQHDDALKVWLNGELVVDAGFDGTLQCHHIPASAFHEGDNTLAISVNDFGGEAFLDYSLGHLFFLKNVETGKYLNKGNAWGTHAILADEPLPAQLTKQTDGSYTIFFPYESWNQQLLFVDESLANVYVDYNGQESPACRYWTITDAGNGNYHIQTLNATDTYLGNNPDKEALDGNGEEMHNRDDVDANTAASMNITWTLEPEGLHTAAQAERLQELITQANALQIDTSWAQEVLDNANSSYTEALAQILKMIDEINGGIWFEDEKVKELCVARWDTSKDGELSRAEVGDVTDLGEVFKGNTQITSFNELRYFTGLTSIGDEAFEGCTNLTSVELPEGLLRIGGCEDGGAFHESGLTSIKFPSTVTSVGHAAFQGCESLTSIDFNGCTATLEGAAFSWCSSLEEVYIPNTITLTGYFTFACCEKLKTVIFEEGNPTEGIFFTFWGEYITSQLETVVLPSTAIMGDGMFARCNNLKSVTFLSGEPGEKHFANNFQGCPDDVLFTIPEGTAESYLNRGYHNLSDKGALGTVKGLFEDQAGRILNEMASSVADGDKDVLNAAIGEAREIVEAAEDYMTIYQQIDAIKDAAKAYLATATLSTLTEDIDVTGAMITNPDNGYFDIGWTIGFLGVNNGWQNANYSNEDCTIDSFVESWRPGEVLSDGRHSQTIRDLPVGKYRLEAKAIATWGDDPEQEVTGVSLFIGDQSTPVATANEKPQFFSVEFTNAEAQDVEIGLMVENTTANWVALDDVRLYRLSEDNVLYVEETPSVLSGSKAELNISLKNKDAITAAEFYLQLPEGMTLDKVALNGNRSDGHQVTSLLNDDGYYHIVCYSAQNNAFKENDGELFSMTLYCASSVTAGIYKARVRNILMTDANKHNITLPDFTVSIEVPDLQLGDANGDGGINVGDIVEVVDRIMQRPSETFHFAAANLHYDQKINVLDLVALVKLVLSQGMNQGGSQARATETAPAMNESGITLAADGNGTLTLGVESSHGFIVAQYIVEMPEAMQLNDIQTGGEHTASWQPLGEGRYSVVVYSMKNARFEQNECLLTMSCKGTGAVNVSDILLVDTDRQAHRFYAASADMATGIVVLNGEQLSEESTIYTLDGRKIGDYSKKGVYVINGKKTVVK